MLRKISKIPFTHTYWAIISLSFIAMEGAGLFVQYYLGYQPCAICVQIRVLLFIALTMSLLGQTRFKMSAAILTTVPLLAILERTIYLFNLEREERGLFAGCPVGQAFPDWLPLDSLAPWLFEYPGSCGTPIELAHGVTFTGLILFGITSFMGIMLLTLGLTYRGRHANRR